MKINIKYISWRRNDAIGKVAENQLNELGNKVRLKKIILSLKPENKILYLLKLTRNILNITRELFSRKIIYFEELKQLEVLPNILFRNKRSVATVHHLEERKSGLKGGLEFLIYKRLHRSFAKLIAISKKTKQDLIKKYGISPEKIEVVYHGIDKKIFKPTKKKLKKLKSPYIFYMGSEVPRKNIENLLRAFREISLKYPDLFLVKAGYHGGEGHREKMLKLIKKYDLKDKVILISDYLKEEDLPMYYSNAELFLYPSLKEGFGMPLVEAMACGCPVVTSNLAPMNEIANNQELVNPKDNRSIAKGVNRILSNKRYREVLRKNALKRAGDFDWEKSANKLVKIYEELKSQKQSN